MAEVKVGENESIESALRRFKKKIQKAGILSEVKKRERLKNVKDTKNQALKENVNLKLLVNVKCKPSECINLEKMLGFVTQHLFYID